MDASAARLIAVIEAEILPWTAGLSKREARVLKLFVPRMREVTLKLRDQLKACAAVSRRVRQLWFEVTQLGHPAYQCAPLGLLAHRISDARLGQISDVRLDALMMLWAAKPGTESAEQTYAEE